MATVKKRGKTYSVVYTYLNEVGEKKQKWETYKTKKEADKRRVEIEGTMANGTFISPKNQTVEDFLKDFVSLYGEKKWGISMYDSSTGLIRNYIVPIIGQVPIQTFNARSVDVFVQKLQKTKPVHCKWRKAATSYLTPASIEKIIKLLRCAFQQAVRWELIGKNPFDDPILPKTRYKPRDIWDAEMIRKALDACKDNQLYIAMNLAFACSLRVGEILGLTWNNVHIEDEDIAADNAWIFIDKELERAHIDTIERLGERDDILKVFDPIMSASNKTRLVLKRPKTDSSVRRIWLPKTLAYILREWKNVQEAQKRFLGEEYQDFDLVVALENGRPSDNRNIEKSFSKLRETARLPRVCFHSLRHSSTTYKLKLNHGDLKATQGDTGHAQVDMITKIYAHILDEDRKVNAQKFESAFYAVTDLRTVTPPPEKENPGIDIAQLIDGLQKSPELANTLLTVLQAQKSANRN